MPEAPDLPVQDTAPESAAIESETPPSEESPVAADTTETAQETDEQKNERELAEQKERSEKRARGVQKRLDELTADKYAEREARVRAERELDEWRRAGASQQQQRPPEDREPTRADFADYEDWVAAKAVYQTRREIRAELQARERTVAESRAREQQLQQFTQIRSQFDSRQREFAKTHPDYFDVVNTDDVRIPTEAGAAIHTMEDGPALVMHLAKNPELAKSLWGKAPHEQVYALGQMSAMLKSPRQVSKAPPPGKPVGVKSGDASSPPSDMDGYLRWAAKQGLK